MPIRNFPFSLENGGVARPYLRIRITNPHNGLSAKTYGLIDTGADECAVPAGYAAILGHNLERGVTKQIFTGNGVTTAYAHTTRFEIFHPETEEAIYTIDNTPIDFMPNLNVVLLGVNSFLNRFILEINWNWGRTLNCELTLLGALIFLFILTLIIASWYPIGYTVTHEYL